MCSRPEHLGSSSRKPAYPYHNLNTKPRPSSKFRCEEVPSTPWDRLTRVEESPGVEAVPQADRVPHGPGAVALLVTANSVIAGIRGSYGVGAALVGPQGEVFATSRNEVVDSGRIADPTAHGERQLVDWYFAQKARGQEMPPPEAMTVVSSLDPCIMCAGSLLASGMKVVSLSQDPGAGVDHKGDSSFDSLPTALQEEAKERFSYFGVENGPEFRGNNPLFAGTQLYQNASTLANLDFNRSTTEVSEVFAKLEIGKDEALDPRTLTQTVAGTLLLDLARSAADDVLSHRLTDPRRPDSVLAKKLRSLASQAKQDGHEENAAVLVGPFGDVLCSATGKESLSPIRTPVFEISRAYNRLRNAVSEDGKRFFPPFSHCRLVTLKGPAADAVGLAEIGGFCSSAKGGFVEGSDRHWQFLEPRQSPEQLKELLDNLPPRYSVERRPDIAAASLGAT